MNLHHLKIFLAVAEHTSFSKASDVLGISQPAVSVQVRKLEEELGIPLVEQLGKNTHLTHAGEFLRDQARLLFRLAEEIEEQLGEFRGLKTGTLKLGASTTPGTYLIPTLLQTFKRLYPQVTVSLQLGNTRFIASQLAENKIDLAILGQDYSPSSEFTVEKWLVDQLLVVCSADHPLAKKNILTWEEARAYPFIFREPGSSTRHVFERWLVQNNLPNPSGTELASTEAIKRAIAGSTNLGVLSSLAVEWEIAANHLVSLPIIGFNLERTFCLAQHKDKRPTPLLQEFKRFLLNNQRS